MMICWRAKWLCILNLMSSLSLLYPISIQSPHEWCYYSSPWCLCRCSSTCWLLVNSWFPLRIRSISCSTLHFIDAIANCSSLPPRWSLCAVSGLKGQPVLWHPNTQKNVKLWAWIFTAVSLLLAISLEKIT